MAANAAIAAVNDQQHVDRWVANSPLLPTFLRATLGTADEMTDFFVAFQEIFRS